MATDNAETHVTPAKVERTDGASAPADTVLLKPDPAPLPPIPQGPGTGDDPMDFVRAQRIHVKDGSLFIDPYLVIHPRELAPDQETQLRKKLQLTYSINNPSFFESPDRAAIALNLGQLVPVSMAAKRSQLMDQVKQFNAQVDKGGDASLEAQLNDKHHPFAAIVRDTVQTGEADPASLELLKNGIGLYLLVRQKLTENGFYNRLTDYVTRLGTPDQILGDLADNIGVTPRQVREAALKGGIDGVGTLLGLAPDYIADVKRVANYAATQDFGFNLVEHWYLGRQQLGSKPSLEEKIATGIDTRITTKINEYRARVHHHYDVPVPIQSEERRIAEALKLVDPIQRKLMYALGYEICFSPEMTADDIAFHRGIYGLHRKAANDLRDIRGTYRIYFSGKGDLEGSMRTLVHEIAHNMWPEQFSPQQVQQIDALANSDAARFATLHRVLADPERFTQLNRLISAYQAGTAQEKAAIAATADEFFGDRRIAISPLLPKLHDAHALRHLVAYAQDTLQVEGARYAKSGYDSPQERFREVISRFAEMKQVRLRSEPEMLQFLCPGLDRIWNEQYLPHLHQVYDKVLRTNPSHGTGRPTRSHRDAEPVAPEPTAPEPAVQAEPKVEERPVGPKADAACRDAIRPPDTRIATSGIEITPAIAHAEQALKSMGVRFSL